MDWNNHYTKPVKCIFTPRENHNGRPMRPGMAEKAGTPLELVTMWKMDNTDFYPGEYALSTVDSSKALVQALGVSWIASGDVTVSEPSTT